MPTNSPGANKQWFEDVVSAWRSLRPLKKFLGLSVDEFEAELKPCFDTREEIADLENKLTGARNRRDEADVEGLDLVDRLVNAIKADEAEGDESGLLEAVGYVIPSKRKSGLHRGPTQPTTELPAKAA